MSDIDDMDSYYFQVSHMQNLMFSMVFKETPAVKGIICCYTHNRPCVMHIADIID